MKYSLRKILMKAQSQLVSSVGLFDYRLKNLCVAAEPTALLPVKVLIEGNLHNLEQMSKIGLYDWNKLRVKPMDFDDMQSLAMAIKHVHPEFKQDVVCLDDSDDEEQQCLELTMPEVNSDRHDLLVNTTNLLFDELEPKMKAIRERAKADLALASANLPLDQQQKAKDELEEFYSTAVEEARKVKENKMEEIEHAYQQFMEEQAKLMGIAGEKSGEEEAKKTGSFKFPEEKPAAPEKPSMPEAPEKPKGVEMPKFPWS